MTYHGWIEGLRRCKGRIPFLLAERLRATATSCVDEGEKQGLGFGRCLNYSCRLRHRLSRVRPKLQGFRSLQGVKRSEVSLAPWKDLRVSPDCWVRRSEKILFPVQIGTPRSGEQRGSWGARKTCFHPFKPRSRSQNRP